jgi:plasmid stabilization system protein ParE
VTFDVRPLRRARRDLDEIADWMARERGAREGANAWLRAFNAVCVRLSENASSCALAPEADHLDFDLRETSFGTRRGKRYRVLFKIDGDEVLILRIRGPGQDWIGPDDV